MAHRPCFSFFFSSRRRHTRCSRDWSSDVCSSDLLGICYGMQWITHTLGGKVEKAERREYGRAQLQVVCQGGPENSALFAGVPTRSEERRVGKECRSRWSPYH